MPIYEYRCFDCNRITNVFVRSVSSEVGAPKCEHCGSEKTSRAISKFAVGRTQQQIIEQYGDPGTDRDAEYRDPRQIGRWVEKRFEDYGMDLPDGARDMIDAAREGEFPKPLDEP
jgi:putative FmdB family regulatory protein